MFWVGWGDAPRGVVDRGGRIGYGARQLFFIEFLKLFERKNFFYRNLSNMFKSVFIQNGHSGVMGPGRPHHGMSI